MSEHPQETRDVTSKSIDGISDLVVWAPIKDGFINAFSNVTYETRLRLVAEALHNIRQSAREHETLEPFADTAKRILSLLDFRIGIVDRDLRTVETGNAPGDVLVRPSKFMYLVATFDGPWEPYIRLIWKPLGSFLDLVLCNCDGYPLAANTPFETYAKWVRDNQLDSAIFYSTSGLTVKDKIYLEELERTQRFEPVNVSFESIARMTSDNPDEAAQAVRDDRNPTIQGEVLRLALEALNVLYKLTDYYPGDAIEVSGDGRILLRAVRDLLAKFGFEGRTPKDLQTAFKDQIDWFMEEIGEDDLPETEDLPVPPDSDIQKGLLTSYDAPGSLTTHGALLMIRVDDPEKAREFLKKADWSWEDNGGDPPYIAKFWRTIFMNVAFTFKGLETLGVGDLELAAFPKEFREGMADRATMLGDKWGNHPRRWTLPARNWLQMAQPAPPIELSEIDLIIQARSGTFFRDTFVDEFKAFESVSEDLVVALDSKGGIYGSPEDSLSEWFLEEFAARESSKNESVSAVSDDQRSAFDQFYEAFIEEVNVEVLDGPLDLFTAFIHYLGKAFGFTILGVESMFRQDVQPINSAKTNEDEAVDDNPESAGLPTAFVNRDHFGFKDGISQPRIEASTTPPKELLPSEVYRGDIFYGYRNTRGDRYVPGSDNRLTYDGSFLVVRKIAQDVPQFLEIEEQYSSLGLAEKMVGRTRDGDPLLRGPYIPPPGSGVSSNDFTFENDMTGEACPFSAHIRLANPREEDHQRKPPMIVRRGMSYGARYSPPQAGSPYRDDGVARGVMFMAYCANLAEQYEVIQRWLNDGNSTDTLSGQNDPLTGARPKENSGEQAFRFVRDYKPTEGVPSVKKVEVVKTQRPFTKLEWGHYFFVPSRKGIAMIAANPPTKPRLDAVESGRAILDQIKDTPQESQRTTWKRILEDFLAKDPTRHDIAPRVFQAIDAEGGAYRIEAGVPHDVGDSGPHKPVILVTNADLIREVFDNSCIDQDATSRPYSSKEQDSRINASKAFGRIYVGLDAPCPERDMKAFKDSVYVKEAYPTNDHIMAYTREQAIVDGFVAGQKALAGPKTIGEKYANPNDPASPQVKIELGRQYIAEALANLCRDWFGIPNDHDGTEKSKIDIEAGGWTWKPVQKPKCPGSFLSPSRHAFYPRPSKAITDYGLRHGSALRQAVKNHVDRNWDVPAGMKGSLGKKIYDSLRHPSGKSPLDEEVRKELLGRNLIGIMIGALPPMDANLRWTLFDWLENETLWRHQHDLYAARPDIATDKPSEFNEDQREEFAEAVWGTLGDPLSRAMCMRPAPDLIYRTVVADEVNVGNVTAKRDETIILCLSAAMQAGLRAGQTPIDIVFGGDRKDEQGGALPPTQHALHACPAQDMAMGGMVGILAALLAGGRIQPLPASLIVRLSNWPV